MPLVTVCKYVITLISIVLIEFNAMKQERQLKGGANYFKICRNEVFKAKFVNNILQR